MRTRVRIGCAAAATAVTALGVAACAGGSSGPPGMSTVAGRSTSSAVPAPGSTSSSAPAGKAAAVAGPAGGPVPAGFSALDLTFVGADEGWLLGTAPCDTKPCTSIVRTTDGGRTWTGIPAPKANLASDGPKSCDSACVWGLRFADPKVGYAYGPNTLYLTTDGGATWHKQPGQADAIEIGDGTVLRVSHGTKGCPPGCDFRLSSAAEGSADFRTLNPPVTLTGDAVRMLRTGKRVFLQVFQNPAGGSEDAHALFLTSADDGRHWTSRHDPCGTRGGTEADSADMAVSAGGSLAVLCRVRSGGPDFVITSTDGGAAFGAHHPAPKGGADAIGTAGNGVVLVSVGGTLYRSGDGGHTWKGVATATPAGPDTTSGVLGFETDRTGRWVPGSGTVLSTSDGGATWTGHTFPK